MPKDRGSNDKDSPHATREKSSSSGGGKETRVPRLCGILQRRSSSASLVVSPALHEGSVSARDPAVQEFAERARRSTQAVLTHELPATIERLGALYDRMGAEEAVDTQRWAEQVVREMLSVRHLLSTLNLCFALGVPGTGSTARESFQTDVLVQFAAITKKLAAIMGGFVPLKRSTPLACLASLEFVIKHKRCLTSLEGDFCCWHRRKRKMAQRDIEAARHCLQRDSKEMLHRLVNAMRHTLLLLLELLHKNHRSVEPYMREHPPGDLGSDDTASTSTNFV